jgi:acetylornithine deacetylase
MFSFSADDPRDLINSMELNEERFVGLMHKLIGVVESLQNNPAQGLVPRENNASDHVLALLEPFMEENGGPLQVERVEFTEGRGNVVVTYPGTGDKTLAFVGSHMDVVPANPETWERNPFSLSVEGDKLYGRGTTDCLGHVAMITDLLCTLAEKKPKLERGLTVVFIANEENGVVTGIGVDRLMETGKIDHIKNGPVIWVDCADKQPCIGTAGSITWHLKGVGKLFHSGLPHKGINALELVQEACKSVQDSFYKDFPVTEQEKRYNFATPSTMKPTQMDVSVGAINQLPAWATMSGDIRLTPFYEVADAKAKIEGYVAALNADIGQLPCHGPVSKYVIEDSGDGITQGKIELVWGEGAMEGIACNLDGEAYSCIVEATKRVLGEVTPYAICGSLPLVRDLQRGGYDVQLTGFGLSSTYHADNEYCHLSDMKQGFKILAGCVDIIAVDAA